MRNSILVLLVLVNAASIVLAQVLDQVPGNPNTVCNGRYYFSGWRENNMDVYSRSVTGHGDLQQHTFEIHEDYVAHCDKHTGYVYYTTVKDDVGYLCRFRGIVYTGLVEACEQMRNVFAN